MNLISGSYWAFLLANHSKKNRADAEHRHEANIEQGTPNSELNSSLFGDGCSELDVS